MESTQGHISWTNTSRLLLPRSPSLEQPKPCCLLAFSRRRLHRTKPAMPRRRRCPGASLPLDDRDLAEEVLYLHSLWRRGPPAPAHVPVPVPAASLIPSRSAGRKRNRKRRRLEPDAAAENEDAGSDWPLARSPAAASPKTWPDASTSAPANPPPQQKPSPEWLAQREALRAAEEFFSSRRGTDDDSDDDGGGGGEGAESEGEEDAAAFFAGLFERDAALRAHYERRCEDGQFACMACAGTKVRRGKVRRFRGCVALVQHARAAMRYGRPGAHRALAAAVCRVLGWDVERLPSIVMDRRGTLGQALAAEATSDAQEAKETDDTGDGSSCDEGEEEEEVETGVDDSSTDGDEEADEPEIGKESAEQEDTEEIGTPNCRGSYKIEVLCNETVQEDVETRMEHSKSNGDEDAPRQDNIKESTRKGDMEEIDLLACVNIYKNEVPCNETVQEVNGNKDDSLSQDNNGEVHKQEIVKETGQQEVGAAETKNEHDKTADTGETAVTRLVNRSSTEKKM